MEFTHESGLKLKLDKDNHTATVIKQPATNNVIYIPRFVEFESGKYIIKSISDFAIKNAQSVEFPKDSEIETFESSSFYSSTIKKLQIPASLINLKDGWCDKLIGLTDIEISPDNKKFSIYNNQFLVGKSDINKKDYDTLYYVLYNIDEVIIPPQIKFVKPYSMSDHHSIKTIIFHSNSEIKSIEKVFMRNSFKKLVLPASIEKNDDNDFKDITNLTIIDISNKNKTYSYIDNKILVKKSNPENSEYDIIAVARRDIQSITIPSYIKIISNYAFQNCTKLKSIKFDSDSNLQIIGNNAFENVCIQEKIIIPKSVNKIGIFAFEKNPILK